VSAPGLEQLLGERVDGRHRGFGAVADGLTVGALGSQGYDLARGDLPLPLLALRESALEHNLRVMHGWCTERGLSLAPHGKTAMAPQLIRRQLDAGAWGMTAANVQQVAVMRAAGAARVILANQVVGAAELGWLARERDAGVEVYVLVDSVEGVRLLDTGWADATSAAAATRDAAASGTAATSGGPDGGAGAPLPVLIELGGARAGCRTDEQALAVAAAVAAAPRLTLAGIEGFEGTLGADREPATLAAVDAFLDRMRGLVESLDARGAFAGTPEIVATAGGQRAVRPRRRAAPLPGPAQPPGSRRAALGLLPDARRRALRPRVAALPAAARARAVGARAVVPGAGARDCRVRQARRAL
jgi:D-serine dehydratase